MVIMWDWRNTNQMLGQFLHSFEGSLINWMHKRSVTSFCYWFTFAKAGAVQFFYLLNPSLTSVVLFFFCSSIFGIVLMWIKSVLFGTLIFAKSTTVTITVGYIWNVVGVPDRLTVHGDDYKCNLFQIRWKWAEQDHFGPDLRISTIGRPWFSPEL